MAPAILFQASLAASFLAFASLHAASVIPHVSEEMQTPEFWIERLPNRKAIIMSPEAIGRLNHEIRRCGYRVRPMYEHHRVSGRNTVRILREQLESLTHWKKFDRENNRLRDPGFYGRMASLVAIEDIPGIIQIRYGLAIRRTPVRLMPTDMPLQRKPNEPQFDILQSSVLDIGQPVALYHLSRDGEWGAVQTAFGFGWVRLENVGWSSSKIQVENYLTAGPPVVTLANSVTVFADSGMRVSLAHLRMGSWLPLDGRVPGAYGVRIPERSRTGELQFGRAFIPICGDAREGYQELTEEAIIRAAFRQFGDLYGWGEAGVGTDCSRFILNIFSVFGVELPRTSFLQIKSLSIQSAPDRLSERSEFLESLPAGRTLLQFPGHIGLYLGAVGGRHYMIHSLSVYRVPDKGADSEMRADRVLVSDLSLGQGSRKGSYLKNLEKAGVLR